MKKNLFENNFNLRLDENDVHIWHFDLNNFIENKDLLKELLSQDELQKAHSFHFEIDSQRYVCSHGILRILISAYTGISPYSIKFSFNSFGKPAVEEFDNKLSFQFNLSHSENYACYGFTKNSHIGIDIEFLGSIPNFLELAERYFSEAENKQLLSLPKKNFQLGFYNCWTSKEAVVKALGEGLSFPLKDFNVRVDPLNIDQTKKYNLLVDKVNKQLFIETFRAHSDFTGAYACTENLKSTTYWSCEDEPTFAERFFRR